MAFDNNCSFTGNLTKDVDFTVTPDGLAVAKFSIAVDNGKDSKGDKKPPTYVSFKAFRKAAETIANNTSKGSKIGIIARYDSGFYMKGEQKIYTHDFIVEDFKFLSFPRSNNQQTDNQPPYQQNQPSYNSNQSTYQQNQTQHYGGQSSAHHTYQQNQPPYTYPNNGAGNWNLNGPVTGDGGDNGLPF